MPIIPGPVQIPNQVLPNGQAPYTQQYNCAGLIGAVQMWNSDLSQPKILNLLNDALKTILDRKTWYGMFIKGQLVAPQAVTLGQATTTLGSTTVVGTGTAWTTALIGLQFRIGYNCPIYSITNVDPVAQTLTLELPWGAPSTTSGYFIVQYYFNFGPNIKYVKTMLNMQLGYKFHLHATQDTLNTLDPWRQNQNFPWLCAGMPAAPDGSYLSELYPASWIQQAFPFTAYVVPPNLVNDNDNLPPLIRGDVLIKHAIANALVIGGQKKNAFYDPATSRTKMQEFNGELAFMANADENLYRTDIVKFGEDMPYYNPGGALWAAQHCVAAGGTGGGYEL
jgi:hypothetical protein